MKDFLENCKMKHVNHIFWLNWFNVHRTFECTQDLNPKTSISRVELSIEVLTHIASNVAEKNDQTFILQLQIEN